MRTIRLSQPRYSKICRALAVCAAYFAMAGCTDDTFDKFQNNKDGDMAFEVTAPDNWTEGAARASRPAGVAISRLESDYGRQLYLISEVSASPDSVVALPASRGSVVTGDAFHPSFGLSAICYTGTWTDTDEWLGKWTTNFAHDIKMAKSGQYWQAASPSEDLDWTGSGRVRFFAYAPYPGDIAAGSLSHSAEGAAGIPTVDFEATTDVKKQVDLLSTYADCDAAKGGTVQLVFKHALTAITIKTGEGMLAGKVTEVKFTGIGTKGTHEIGTGRWTGVSSPKDFTVTLDKTLEENGSANTAPGQEIVGGDLTFLMVPQTLGSDAKLIIKYTDKLSGVDRTLTASLSGTEWKAGTRVAYSVNTSGIKVVPEVDFSFECVLPTKSTAEGDTKIERGMEVPTSGYIPNFRVKSRAEVYQLDGSNHTASKTIDLPFTVEYSLDGGEWTDGGWKQHTEADKDHYATGCVLLKPRDVFVQMRGSMYTNPANGTAESHYDLSKGGETANCYMINAPGYYSLPLVYGNARNNPNAYTCMSTPAEGMNDYVLMNFVGNDDQAISSPNIYEDESVGDAVLIWQDSPDLVRNVRLDSQKQNLLFQIDREAINQGSAVVAVRASDASKTILWNWHIWVTESDWSKGLILTKSTGYDKGTPYEFSPCNLGYCDPHGADDAPKSFKIRVSATLPVGDDVEAVGKEVVKSVEKEAGQTIIEASLAGDNTYYQWGRKDPMLPGIWNEKTLAYGDALKGTQSVGTVKIKDENNIEVVYEYTKYSDIESALQFDMDNKPYYPGEYLFVKEDTYDGSPDNEGGRSIGDAIRYPFKFFSHENTGSMPGSTDVHNFWRRHWHNGANKSVNNGGRRTIMNYWDANLVQNSWVATNDKYGENPPHGQIPRKTIYDPCPVGFCVPNVTAFSNFGKTSGVHYIYYGQVGQNVSQRMEGGYVIGWDVKLERTGTSIFLPATGLRDMGEATRALPDKFKNSSNPAHSKLTFIASTIFERHHSSHKIGKGPDGKDIWCPGTGYTENCHFWNYSSGCIITYIDDRGLFRGGSELLEKVPNAASIPSTYKPYICVNNSSNNAYGFTIRPMKDTNR